MLTRKQHDLLILINDRLQQTGVAPSFEEMKDAVGLKSKSGIHRLINALEERGFIRRLPNRARALEVLRLPDADTSSAQNHTPLSSDSADILRPAFGSSPQPVASTPAHAATHVEIPLHGRIAAGTPIEALEQVETIDVPASMIGSGPHYALTVDGDSMVEAGILDGDTIVIRQCNTANDGTIIVALVDGEEATLKTLRQSDGRILLEPANRDYQTQIYRPEQVQIQGRLVGLLRQYH
ncbi:MAG: repressor LexA [Kordiimonas sp.]|nr:repressor LexA [Kordiimonas sp.]|tara:strand:- start:1114 stop:1827 length:714 start_codon:yes stop_codon:yes gene_type:complete